MKIKIFLISFILFLTNCGPLSGGLITNTTYAGEYNQNNDVKSEKTAEGCQASYFGLVGIGDASAGGTAKNAGIRKIASIDYSSFSVLGFVYRKLCTVVSGEG